MNRAPLVSVVLNVYNESADIENCLGRIRNQNYPQNKIEIILVDDDSEDDTIERAKKFNVRVTRSGYKNRERAKSIGIEYARGEFILFMDADIFLIGNDWIKRAVVFLLENPSAVAVQNIRWQYKKNDYLANSYCNLFGINDPFVLFLGKRGALMATEYNWPNKKSIVKKTKDYFLVKFNPDNLPTMGAQGFIARRKLILKGTCKPYFFHLDVIYELVENGFNQFILAKLPIEHQYITTVREFHEKLARNLTLFLELEDKRKYKYEVGSAKFFVAILVMMSLVYPFFQALRGYLKKRDPAWFLHPVFCFTVPIIYFFIFFKFRLSAILRNNILTHIKL